jgi:hypothetical protein
VLIDRKFISTRGGPIAPMGPTTQPNRLDGDLPAGADGVPTRAKADDPVASRSTVMLLDRGPASEMVLRLVFNSKARRDEVVEQRARSRVASRPSVDWPPTWRR